MTDCTLYLFSHYIIDIKILIILAEISSWHFIKNSITITIHESKTRKKNIFVFFTTL